MTSNLQPALQAAHDSKEKQESCGWRGWKSSVGEVLSCLYSPTDHLSLLAYRRRLLAEEKDEEIACYVSFPFVTRFIFWESLVFERERKRVRSLERIGRRAYVCEGKEETPVAPRPVPRILSFVSSVNRPRLRARHKDFASLNGTSQKIFPRNSH